MDITSGVLFPIGLLPILAGSSFLAYGVAERLRDKLFVASPQEFERRGYATKIPLGLSLLVLGVEITLLNYVDAIRESVNLLLAKCSVGAFIAAFFLFFIGIPLIPVVFLRMMCLSSSTKIVTQKPEEEAQEHLAADNLPEFVGPWNDAQKKTFLLIELLDLGGGFLFLGAIIVMALSFKEKPAVWLACLFILIAIPLYVNKIFHRVNTYSRWKKNMHGSD